MTFRIFRRRPLTILTLGFLNAVQPDNSEEILKNIPSLPENLKKKIFGQDRAIDEIYKLVRVSQSGLRETNKLVGCLLFKGPTGVGKTQLALELADALDVEPLRLDMSLYQEKHQVAKLIGSPPGYIGYGKRSVLKSYLNKVKNKPYNVIIADEMEKAHEQLHTFFLGMMDTAQITDEAGYDLDFSKTIFIMTSNVGEREKSNRITGVKDTTSRQFTEAGEHHDAVLRKNFSPEFLNRIDEIITFNSLPADLMRKISAKELARVGQVVNDKGVQFGFSDAAIQYCVEKGYDPVYGARPLKRLINKKLNYPLSEKLLSKELENGDTIFIDMTDNELGIICGEEAIALYDASVQPAAAEPAPEG